MTEDEIRSAFADVPVVDPATCAHLPWWNGAEVLCARCGEFVGGVEHSQRRHPSSQPAKRRGYRVAFEAGALLAVGSVCAASAVFWAWLGWRIWQVIA